MGAYADDPQLANELNRKQIMGGGGARGNPGVGGGTQMSPPVYSNPVAPVRTPMHPQGGGGPGGRGPLGPPQGGGGTGGTAFDPGYPVTLPPTPPTPGGGGWGIDKPNPNPNPPQGGGGPGGGGWGVDKPNPNPNPPQGGGGPGGGGWGVDKPNPNPNPPQGGGNGGGYAGDPGRYPGRDPLGPPAVRKPRYTVPYSGTTKDTGSYVNPRSAGRPRGY